MNGPTAAVASSDTFTSAPHSIFPSAVASVAAAVDEPPAAVASSAYFAPAPHSAIVVTVSVIVLESKFRTAAKTGNDAAFDDSRCAAEAASAEAHAAGTHSANAVELTAIVTTSLAILLLLSPTHCCAPLFLPFPPCFLPSCPRSNAPLGPRCLPSWGIIRGEAGTAGAAISDIEGSVVSSSREKVVDGASSPREKVAGDAFFPQRRPERRCVSPSRRDGHLSPGDWLLPARGKGVLRSGPRGP